MAVRPKRIVFYSVILIAISLTSMFICVLRDSAHCSQRDQYFNVKQDVIIVPESHRVPNEAQTRDEIEESPIKLKPDLNLSRYANLNYLAPINDLKNTLKSVDLSLDELKNIYVDIFQNPPGRSVLTSKDGQLGWVENGVEYQPKYQEEGSKRYGVSFSHPSDFEYYVPFRKSLFFQGKKNVQKTQTIEPKIILWHSPIGYVRQSKKLEKLRFCPDFPCRMTTNKKYADESSALVFDGFKLPDSPPPRKSDQVFVFHFVERPISPKGKFTFTQPAWRKVFNWTMTYRTDSDIPVYYGFIRKRPEPLVKDYKALIGNKTKMAASLISHCETNSKRKEYIEKLQNYIQVDVYGHCGPHNCQRGKDDECGEMISSQYKFYFSFENSLCKDYFTEKFFRYMNTDAVIVARGGEGYWRHAPRGTFINAADFKSPKKLAEYLNYLDKNPKEYEAILREKHKYVSLFEAWFHINTKKAISFIHYHYEAIPFCQMCQWLWNINDHVRTDLDVSDWLKTRDCIEPENFGQ